MKTLFTILLIGSVPGFAYAQKLNENDVPASVRSSFQKQYPGIKVEKWEKEGNNYEAEFKAKKTETSVVYDANGNFLESEVEIAVSDLPKEIIDYLNINLPGEKIKEAAKITATDGRISYEAEVAGEDYIFEANGNFVSKEKDRDGD